jgi:hypothetical protein
MECPCNYSLEMLGGASQMYIISPPNSIIIQITGKFIYIC